MLQTPPENFLADIGGQGFCALLEEPPCVLSFLGHFSLDGSERLGSLGLGLLENGGLLQLFGDTSSLAYDCYFVYPEELKSVARVQVFRDFLVAKAQRWHF